MTRWFSQVLRPVRRQAARGHLLLTMLSFAATVALTRLLLYLTVPKGEYVLTATKVAADQWHLNVLSKADRSKVADIPLAMSKADPSVEMFTVELRGEKDKGEFAMTWGTTALKAGFTAK